MSSDRVVMTREGYDKLKTDLDRMTNVEMLDVAVGLIIQQEDVTFFEHPAQCINLLLKAVLKNPQVAWKVNQNPRLPVGQ